LSDDPDRFDDADDGFEPDDLMPHEIEQVKQDLADLADFQATFAPEGYRGVSVWCQDCAEEHLYPWEMLRGNLETLLETGETPVHEPAFAPEPQRYIPWDYGRGYVDALKDVGADQRHELDACNRCGYDLRGDLAIANFCPRCGSTLLRQRLADVLAQLGLDPETVESALQRIGVTGKP
jgi:hypothetical protein